MTKTHAALQLLALGPLTTREFREITGWPPRVCSATLYHLSSWGMVKLEGRTWRLDELVAAAPGGHGPMAGADGEQSWVRGSRATPGAGADAGRALRRLAAVGAQGQAGAAQ